MGAPITGTFKGDFANFLQAIDKAQIAVVDFGKSAAPVEKQLNKMVDGFSGRNLIQQASLMTIAVEKAGGVATLTGKELEQVGNKANDAAAKLRALGYEVPAGLQHVADETRRMKEEAESASGGFGKMYDAAKQLAGLFGIGLGVSTIVGLTKEVFATADALTKLHDKTGIGIQSLQILSEVADESGNSLEDVTNAVSKMQIKIAGGDSSAVKALDQLHISLSVLRTLRPDQQFAQIAEAIKQVPDPADRARLAFELFGKSGAEILPTLRADIIEIAAQTRTMSDETVKRLDAAGDAWHRYWTNLKAEAGNTFDFLFLGYARADAAAKKASEAGNIHPPNAPSTGTLLPTTDPFAIQDALDRSGPALKQQIKNLEDLIKAQTAAKKAAEELAKTYDKIGGIEGLPAGISGHITTLTYDVKASIGEWEKLSAELDKVERNSWSANFGFKGLADGLDKVGQKVPPLGEAFNTIYVNAIEKGTLANRAFNASIGKLWEGISGGVGIGGAVQNIGKGFVDGIGKLLTGGLTSLVNLGIGAVGSLFGKLFGNPEKEINPIRQAFVDTAGGLDALNQKAAAAGVTLTAMLNAKNPEQYKKAIDDLNAAFDLSDKAMKAADDTVTKFGLTVDQLGPKFKQQKLDEQAASLVNDYKLLDAVVADHATTLEKLAPSVNAYIATILKAGGTIPNELKDPIEQMRKLGLLTDDSGQAFTEAQLDGLTFATTLDAKFTTLLEGIQKLVDALSHQLGPAIDNLPSEHTVHIGYQVDAPPDLGGSGYRGEAIAAASGYEGIVTRPTLFLAGEAGSERVSIGPPGGGNDAALAAAIAALPGAIRIAVRDGLQRSVVRR